jgi:hypothetical protein
METKQSPQLYKISYLFALAITIQIFIGGLNSFRLSEKTGFNASKTLCDFIIINYFSSNSQGGDDLPISTEKFELK